MMKGGDTKMQEQEEQKNMEDWRNNISEPKATLKIADGNTVFFTFADEGRKHSSTDYGTSIVFSIMLDNEKEPRNWFVSSNNFDLLGQIKTLGELTGLKCKVSRKGARKSDTRYYIEKV